MELTTEEKVLAARIDFDEDVLERVRQCVNKSVGGAAGGSRSPLTYYRGYDKGRLTKPDRPPPEGLSITVPMDVKPLADYLRQGLSQCGYLAFVLERYLSRSNHSNPGRLAVLRTENQFDIIRAGYPEGNNDHIDNATILRQLRDWDRRYGIEVIGANGDWLELRFKTIPADKARAGEEAIALCPDLRSGYWEIAEEQARRYYPFRDDEEGIESQMGYVVGRDIARAGRLFLWWDRGVN